MQDQKLGFIGLGVMGEPMCRNLAAKARHAAVVAFDLRPEPLARLATDGVAGARSIAAWRVRATGASAKCAPRASKAAASSRASATGAVLQSTIAWPLRE